MVGVADLSPTQVEAVGGVSPPMAKKALYPSGVPCMVNRGLSQKLGKSPLTAGKSPEGKEQAKQNENGLPQRWSPNALLFFSH